MKAVIRLGGSTFASPPSPELIRRYVKVISGLREQGHELAVIVGGGSLARQFIQFARELGLTVPEQDEVAISVSKLYAQLLAIKLGLDWKDIPTSTKEAARLFQSRKIVVMGGVKPGWTTDTVAASVASKINADLIVKATDQDGVYTKDPKKHPDARKLDRISFDELDLFLEEDKHTAGIHQIIDPEAVRILKKRKMRTIVVNGFEPENLAAAIRGEEVGTVIQ